VDLALYVVTSPPAIFEPELDAISFLHLSLLFVGGVAADVQPPLFSSLRSQSADRCSERPDARAQPFSGVPERP
jgi:hypothetical protein